ncbi:MAG: hypothetical protein RL497_1862 [Pseudomonadota bacterium]|jgi:hypothetical protein
MKLITLIFLTTVQIPAYAETQKNAFDFPTSRTHEHTKFNAHSCAHKPGAEISISGREFFYMQPGQFDNLAVDLTGTVGKKITVQLSADTKGLALQGPKEITLDINTQQLASFNVPIKALLDGRWVINLIVHSETAEGALSTRALALVVQVGNMVAAGGGQQKATQNNALGTPIIVMPAQEEIF